MGVDLRTAIMRAFLALTLFVAVALASPNRSPRDIFWLEDGELCIEGTQCKSGCCQKEDWIELARCMPKSTEGARCDGDDLWDVYEFCPCENGLKCTRDNSSDGERRCADPNDQ